MSDPPSSDSELLRLAALHRYGLLDTSADAALNDLVQLTAELCQTPIALITFVDRDREWFKARVGITLTELPRTHALGVHTILHHEPTVVPDLRADERFAANPLVIEAPHCRFYAGVPLMTPDGLALGSLCVMDRVPRLFSDREQSALERLARQVMWHLEQSQPHRVDLAQLICDTLPVPVLVSRQTDGLIFCANQHLADMLGASVDTLLHHTTLTLYCDPADRQILIDQVAQRGYIRGYECQIRRIDGTSLWVTVSLQTLRFNGEPASLSVFHDIGDRKQAEAALNQRNELFQTIFDHIPVMVALFNTNGQCQWVNREWERVLGWSLEDVQTHDILAEFYPDPEYRQQALQFMQSAERHWGDFKIRLRDGRILDTAWANVLLSDGHGIGIGQDITERKQTELALQAQAEREQVVRTIAHHIRQSLNLNEILDAAVIEVRQLLQADRVVVYQFAPNMIGRIVAESVDAGWTVSLGRDIEDTCFQTDAGHDYRQGKMRAISNIQDAGLSQCHRQMLEQFEVKANLVVPVLLEATSETGTYLWGLLIAHQCSAPRQWEPVQLDLLDQIAVQLAIAIQQSGAFEQAKLELAERRQTEHQLRAALAEKEVLLKEVHHRVKNNLQIISSLLQLQAQNLTDPQVIAALQESQNRIHSMSLIHKKLYTSSDLGQIDVMEYVQNLATSLLVSYKTTPGAIALQTQLEPVFLNIDQAIPCGLIINELISNALKHAFPQGRMGAIEISLHMVNGWVELTIQDNGIGLPEEVNWENPSSLGLSLVYALAVEQLEGRIEVSRQPKTAFTITFPQWMA